MQINGFNETLPAKGAATVLEDEGRTKVQRLQAFLLALQIYGSERIQTIDSIEVIAAVVTEQQVVHFDR